MYGVNVNEMHFAVVNAIKELSERDSELAQQNSELAEQNQTAVMQLTERDTELAEQNQTLAEQNQTLREEVRLLKARLDAFERTIKLAAS
jgi:predicted RNase H-like nuclease (RuvC/YqgF family)